MGCGDAVRVAAFPIFTSVRLRPRPDRHSHGRPASLLLWVLRDPPAPLLLSQDRPELRHLCVLGRLVSLELRRDLLPPRLLASPLPLPLLGHGFAERIAAPHQAPRPSAWNGGHQVRARCPSVLLHPGRCPLLAQGVAPRRPGEHLLQLLPLRPLSALALTPPFLPAASPPPSLFPQERPEGPPPAALGLTRGTPTPPGTPR